ncbi:hypothetical protein [Nitrosomonas sp.]|uniref:hypothetical protein n=1 Tax=Nitrosomonas sp. TaxID=42353 RepID=UPI0025E2D856|nr:hypothetical protein [Nitrosomonas sp.]
MAAKPKLTPEEWAKVRSTWESDPREGYAWIIDELSIPMTRAALRKVAIREGWVKKAGSKPEALIGTVAKNARVASKVSRNSKVPVKALDNSPKESPVHPASKGNSKKVSKPKVSKVSQTAMVSKVSNDDGSDTINDEPDTIEETIEEADKNPGGRPTLYREEYNDQVHRLCVLGVTDEEIAKYFGVSKNTITNWKNEHPEFLASMEEGKMEADADVAMSTYKSATGKHYVEEEKIVVGEGVRNLRRQIPPDVAAQRMWLFNRRPKEWKNKVEVQEDINLNVFPPKEVLDAVYAEALEVARKRDEMLIGRRERLGIVIDHDTGLIDD